jgi:D-alanine-D-alanine ligase
MTAGDRIRLVVIFGGQSAEHEVSLVTARHVLAATDQDRYDIQPIGITREGRWVAAEDAARALRKGPDALPDALDASGPDAEPLPTLVGDPGAGRVVAFPLLHGPLGEDGTVQGLLELAGIPYVGCGVLASALAMDKAMAKEVFAHHGIPQARHVALHEDELRADRDAVLDRLEAELGYPMFVKPSNMGSSVGVTKAHDRAELTGALDEARTYDEWLVVEETIVGREIECAVLGNLDPRASLPGEIRPGAEFYDYEDKYANGAAELIIPAELPPGVTEELQQMAVQAFKALRGEGMARVDFFYEPDGRGLLLNEINTIPGFTPISMYPKMWEASGLAYPDLIDELIRLALERYDRRASRRRSF